MRELFLALPFAAMMGITAVPTALADPLPEILRDLVEQGPDDGDHVVGEEMCARPRWRDHGPA